MKYLVLAIVALLGAASVAEAQIVIVPRLVHPAAPLIYPPARIYPPVLHPPVRVYPPVIVPPVVVRPPIWSPVPYYPNYWTPRWWYFR